MSVTQKIKMIVKDRGITLRYLARKTGLRESALSMALNGKRRLLADELLAICAVLDLDIQDLR